MFSSLMNVWHVPDLRRRLGFTFMIIALYRAGSWLPVPGVNTSSLRDFFGGGANGSILSVLNIFPAARSRTSRCSRSGSCRTSQPRSSSS